MSQASKTVIIRAKKNLHIECRDGGLQVKNKQYQYRDV